MSIYFKLGQQDAHAKYASAYKPVVPTAPKIIKSNQTAGASKVPTLPKPPASPAAKAPKKPGMPAEPKSSQEPSKPDAMAAAEAVGGTVQNAHANASAGMKAAAYQYGVVPDVKPSPGEIRPDNGKTLAEVTRYQGRDRMGAINQTFHAVDARATASSNTNDSLKVH